MANLRDKGYPQSREYRVNRSSKNYTIMDDSVPVELMKRALQAERTVQPTAEEELLQRLVTAYNNKAFGNENAPLVSYHNQVNDIENNLDTALTVRDRAGDRLGYVSRELRPDEAQYSAAIDNGNPDRGMLDAELRTPLGKIMGGYDAETNYGSYSTPKNDDYGFDIYYAGENGSKELDTGITRDDTDKLALYAFLKGIPIKESSYNEINTPLGTVGIGRNANEDVNNGEIYGDYTPNQYIQALINLLSKKR